MAEGALESLAARVELLEKQVQGGLLDGYIDQKGSPLGPKRHCRAVRRLVSEGNEGAAIVGRRFLLSKSAIKEELRSGVSPGISSAQASNEDDAFYRDLLDRNGVEVTHGERDPSSSRR